MRKLFVNEWMKMKYSPLLWILLGGILVFTLLMGLMPAGAIEWLEYGVPASFGYMSSCGTMFMMLLSPVVGVFFAQELQLGTMQNTLSCGVKRGQYFAVKAICCTVIGFLIYLISMLEFTLLRGIRTGFLPGSGEYPVCGIAEAFVFQLGCCVQQITYISYFLFISVLSKRTAIVNLSGIVIWFGEAALTLGGPVPYKGPLVSLVNSYELWKQGKVLTLEFLRQYEQCIIISIVLFVLSYLIFRKRDIQ